jgi:hypothetical protein
MVDKDSRALSERKAIVWIVRAISYLVYFYLIVVEIILFIGFFLLLFGANPSAGFTQWAYRNLDRVMEPFRGIFTPIQLGSTSGDVAAVFDTSVLFAMIIYGIIALALSALIAWLSSRLWKIESAEQEIAHDAEIARQRAEFEAQQAAAQQIAAQQIAAQQAAAQPPSAQPTAAQPTAAQQGVGGLAADRAPASPGTVPPPPPV